MQSPAYLEKAIKAETERQKIKDEKEEQLKELIEQEEKAKKAAKEKEIELQRLKEIHAEEQHRKFEKNYVYIPLL
mgnify:CR=1 FL=1